MQTQRGGSIWIDNYDLLEKVTATGMVELEGTSPEGILALRNEYSKWEVPRNEKKACSAAFVTLRASGRYC